MANALRSIKRNAQKSQGKLKHSKMLNRFRNNPEADFRINKIEKQLNKRW